MVTCNVCARQRGTFKNETTLNKLVGKDDELGTIDNTGSQNPVLANCSGFVTWILEDGAVKINAKLYEISDVVPAVILAVTSV